MKRGEGSDRSEELLGTPLILGAGAQDVFYCQRGEA
jgi:hypothetical protein